MNMPKAQIAERGQAAAELALVLPIIMFIIVGILVLGRLFYIHLALITATNDCVTAASQAMRSDAAYAQGNLARQQSLATFSVPQRNPGGLGYANDATCQTGYTAGKSIFFEGGGTWDPSIFTIYYQFSLPIQPYKSDWNGLP